ncbi:MAG TPA: glycosyltransferase [Bacteroidia bacterium]|nr:glycosyltransferase [Bacteroidia bacterium]
MYIFIASLSRGGAERIVQEQLEKIKNTKVTLIVLYNKKHEYKINETVNIVRLNGKVKNGESLFKEISYRKEHIVCHLASDNTLLYLFSLNVKCSIVFHNDEDGWKNTPEVFNNEKVINLITVSKHIKKQLKKYTNKNIIDVRHTRVIKNQESLKTRKDLGLPEDNKIVVMIGRIAPQKDYIKALELIYPTTYSLLILGGYEKENFEYFKLIVSKIIELKMQDRVILKGFVSNISDYIFNSDMGLNSSKYEGLSIATQEMLSFNIPVFAIENQGQHEILDVNGNLHYFGVNSNPFLREIPNKNKINTNISKVSNMSIRQWSLFNFNEYYPDKNVVFLTQNLGLGGAQKSLVNLLIELNEELIVLNESNTNNFIIKLLENDIPVDYINKRDVFELSMDLLPKLAKYKKVVFWNLDPKMKIIIAKFLPKISIIDVSPGNYCFDELKSETDFMEALTFSDIDYFNRIKTFVSKYSLANERFNYKKEISSKIIVIENGVKKSKLRERRVYKPEKALILGRLAESKYIKEILLAASSSNIDFTFIGSIGKNEKEYMEDIKMMFDKDNIELLGATNDPTMAMKNYDFIITLGLNQGSPNTVLEAISVGLPVISNNSGGTASILGESGILLEEISVKNIEKAINEMTNNYMDFQKKAEVRRIEIIEEYSIENFVKKYREIL